MKRNLRMAVFAFVFRLTGLCAVGWLPFAWAECSLPQFVEPALRVVTQARPAVAGWTDETTDQQLLPVGMETQTGHAVLIGQRQHRAFESNAWPRAAFERDRQGVQGLVGKDIADNLYETAERVDASKGCYELQFFIETDKSPTLAEVKSVFGEPDSNSTAALASVDAKTGEKTRVPLYSYGWLSFLIEKDKVTALVVDFAKNGT